MKTIIIMMICSILYLVTMDIVNKKIESLDFTTTEIFQETNNTDSYEVVISGAVNNPGRYYVNQGDTLGYLVSLAGGLAENADSSTYNLDTILKNASTYYIGSVLDDSIEKVSINTANIALLDTLPGIGNVIAKRIISYRSENGKFKSLEEIKNVDGVGDAMFEQLKTLICL